MFEQRFKRLKIWNKAMDFVEKIYTLTRGFPKGEEYGLTSQLRRASVSVALNIAEGCGGTEAEFNRFLNISLKSAYEIMCGLEIAQRLNYCSENEKTQMIKICNELSAMICGLQKKLKLNEKKS